MNLKPCACGRTPKILRVIFFDEPRLSFKKWGHFYVRCECGLTLHDGFDNFKTAKKAAMTWNSIFERVTVLSPLGKG